jgi:putative salt-induced outer membrane protein YdiY
VRRPSGARSSLNLIAVALALLFPASVQALSVDDRSTFSVAQLAPDATKAEPHVAPTPPGAGAPWRPPEPGTDGFDWIQLKSGEWLKGSLKSMQDYSLEFDSEELEWQEFDWEDVYQVRSSLLHQVLFDKKPGEGTSYTDFVILPQLSQIMAFSDERVSVEGSLQVTRDKVTVQAKEGPIVFDRARLIAITPAGSREIDYWSGKISVGVTMLTGNTDSRGLNFTTDLTRRTPATRLVLDYLGAMEELDGVESANNHRVTTVFDYWLSRRVYVRVPVLEYFSDPFSNVAYRATGVVGLGYDIVYRQNLEWDIFMGPGYQRTRFETVEAGQTESEDTMVFAIGTSAEADLTKRVDLNLSYTGQFVSEEAGGALHHTVATLEIEVTKVLDVDLAAVWDHVSDPQTAADGTTPEKNDLRTSLSLGVEF